MWGWGRLRSGGLLPYRVHPSNAATCAAGTGKLNGRSEQLLGQFLREYPGSPEVAADVRIATKLAAYPWRLTPGQVGCVLTCQHDQEIALV